MFFVIVAHKWGIRGVQCIFERRRQRRDDDDTMIGAPSDDSPSKEVVFLMILSEAMDERGCNVLAQKAMGMMMLQ
jgi:hypothetical protein